MYSSVARIIDVLIVDVIVQIIDLTNFSLIPNLVESEPESLVCHAIPNLIRRIYLYF